MVAMLFRHSSAAPALAIGAFLIAGCGGGSSSSTAHAPSTGAQSSAGTTQSSSSGQSASGGAGALSAEAKSAATGDIPDNQQFLTFKDAKAGFRISYPEGWAQRGGSGLVTFQNNNNLIRIVVQNGAAPTPAQVTAALAKERGRRPSLSYGSTSTLTVQGAKVIKIRYSTVSQPNPVTGKRVKLLVDRYVYSRSGKVAIVDLATPSGVDNVDAYKRISRSMTWR
jgi:hypothetical protein